MAGTCTQLIHRGSGRDDLSIVLAMNETEQPGGLLWAVRRNEMKLIGRDFLNKYRTE